MKFFSTPIWIACGLYLSVSPVALAELVPIPSQSEYAISLNGVWRFKLEQAPPPPRFLGVSGRPIPIEYPTNIEPFYLDDYREDSGWHNLRVPGNWEMAGYSPATYDQPDNASGLYRLKFKVPARWQGRLVKLNFDGVQNGCEIWCNGQLVPVELPSWGRTNYHESGWTAWQADLTSAVKFGAANLLALRVVKNTKSVDCDTGDFFLLGGVDRPVTLFSIPAAHLADFSVRTTVAADRSAEVKVLAQLSEANQGAKLSMRLEGQPPLEAEPDANGQVELTQTVHDPKLWSAEFPNLYSLSLEVKDGEGKVLERVSRRIGLREVSITNGIFCVNHVPVKLAGICRHDIYPTLGTAITPEIWKKDLTLMKGANFNAIRTSHYPYGSGFYDLCDELGFYVIDEEPFCWVNCDDPELKPAFAQRARETVARDKNHPCVVIWGVGNENHPGRDNALAARITRELDPTRPRLISCQHADDGTEQVEFDDAHYVTPQQIHRAESDPRRDRWPMIYTENPNVWDVRLGPDYGSLDLWRAVIVRTWRELWNDDHVSGTFLWEWQDRAVADKCPTKYYYYFPATGINLVKVKGVVDGFRNPRPEYYHIKMAQSPVALSAKPDLAPDAVTFEITNRYSFTDLKVLTVNWELSQSGRKLAKGSAKLSCVPRSQGQVRLSVPAAALAGADTLRLEFEHPGGWNVLTCQYLLKPIVHPPPEVQAVTGITFPRFNFVTGKVVGDGKGWRRLDRQTGELANIKLQRKGLAAEGVTASKLAATPLAQVEKFEADVLVRPGSVPAAHLEGELSGGKMTYRFTWLGNKSDVYELGWIFTAPKGCDRFSWDRHAPWSYYPPDHIGRPDGTARPDSARVDLTKVERPDAFDFNSTKFNCNWASLTDAHQRGLCFVFSPGQRQHVRGTLEASGHCGLVIDRCYSPPRDISSRIVPDLYTVLSPNQTVTGTFQIKN
ncbi:MAG TPA: glycoside hydrolase family 2 TIM barrel-domain containing protein [Verrucomicrobiae bacterium]|nr:glycoside hydrolase family 2 TIM barrel-domain containing protein [Verrucomicrobiae bacterium]